MNVTEVASVLAKAAIFDFRSVEEPDVMAWFEVIGDLEVGDCLAAVSRWYRDRSDRLMPSHLREAVRLVRADRARDARVAAAQQRPFDPPVAAARTRIADLPAEVQAALRPAPGASRADAAALVAERFNGRSSGMPPPPV